MSSQIILPFCLLAVFALTACGGRSAQTVPEQRSYDAKLTCDHLTSEAEVNATRILDLLGEKKDAANRNAMLLLAAPISIVYPFFLDLGDSEQQEISALEKRNARLKVLADQKGCETFKAS